VAHPESSLAWDDLPSQLPSLYKTAVYNARLTKHCLWPPCVADADIIFLPCSLFYLLSFFHRLISAVADWMSTILPHMVWPP